MVAKASTQEGRDKSFAVLNEIIAFAESKGVGHIAIVIGIDDGPDDMDMVCTARGELIKVHDMMDALNECVAEGPSLYPAAYKLNG